tara:strand:+ start:6722 stop:6895 length:174 start_codon:yes stop_codon:yes gene_type:complete
LSKFHKISNYKININFLRRRSCRALALKPRLGTSLLTEVMVVTKSREALASINRGNR